MRTTLMLTVYECGYNNRALVDRYAIVMPVLVARVRLHTGYIACGGLGVVLKSLYSYSY